MTGQPAAAEEHQRLGRKSTAYTERFSSAFNWGRPLHAAPDAEALDHRHVLKGELEAYDHYHRSSRSKEPA